MIRHAALIVAAAVLFLLGTGGSASAAIYRWVDNDGVVNYSDSPGRFEAYQRQVNPERAGPLTEPMPQRSAPADPPGVSTPVERTSLSRIESITVEVMRLSGLDVQVGLVAAMIHGEFEKWRMLGFRPPAGSEHMVARRFNADMLRGNVYQSLARHLGQPQSGVLLTWLRSPLSQRIVAHENASSTADGLSELADFINQLPSAPPTPARLALIHRLERAGEVTDSSAAVAAAAVVALRRTVMPLVSPGVMAQGGLDAQPGSPAIDEGYRLRIMTSLLFTYRDLSDAELGRYVTVLESPTGRWFSQITRQAFLASLETPDPRERPGAATAAGNRKAR